MPKRKRCAAPAIGDTVEVYWPDDKCYYGGRVDDFNKSTHEFCVLYDDGQIEYLDFDYEVWRFSGKSCKEKYKIAHAMNKSRKKRTAKKPKQVEILLKQAHQLVLKVVRKTIRLQERNNSSISPWLAIRIAEDLLCLSFTKPTLVVKPETVKLFSYQHTLLIDEVRNILLQASKIMSPFVLKKREYENELTRVISVGVSLVLAARSLIEK